MSESMGHSMSESMDHCTRPGTGCYAPILVVGVLAISICAACEAHARSEVHANLLPPAQSASAETEPLDLTVRVRAERNGEKWSVAAGDTLRTGDFFELFVHLNQPAYLYVIELLPGDTSSALFPDKGDRLLTAGLEHRIPIATDESFQLDPHDKEENIYILMSRAPVVGAGVLISELGRTQKHVKRTDPNSAKPRRPDRVLSVTRRVIRVRRSGGHPSIVDTSEPRGDSTLVVRLSFKHA